MLLLFFLFVNFASVQAYNCAENEHVLSGYVSDATKKYAGGGGCINDADCQSKCSADSSCEGFSPDSLVGKKLVALGTDTAATLKTAKYSALDKTWQESWEEVSTTAAQLQATNRFSTSTMQFRSA